MCEPFKSWGEKLISKGGITLIGFICAGVVYTDFRDVMRTQADVTREFSGALSANTELLRIVSDRLEEDKMNRNKQ